MNTELSIEFGWHQEALDGPARRGRLETAHGSVPTPCFMPVGTGGTVKAMLPSSVAATGASMVLANAWHLMLRPGVEIIEKMGGLRSFMNWPGPTLTDSGGFQLMSLSNLRDISEEGVRFRSHIDGQKWDITPESMVEVQYKLGTTISMVLDECTSFPATHKQAEESMLRSMRWALRCKEAFPQRRGHALFGIVQGSIFEDLRKISAEELRAIDFPGLAIGGLAVGEGHEAMVEMVEATTPYLPIDKPRYLMGVGKPPDIIEAVARGIDLFDCVLPARSGRTGQAFTKTGPLNILNAQHKESGLPLEADCPCPACREYSRAFLRHMVKSGEILGAMLLTWHNIQFYQTLMADMRKAISTQSFDTFRKRFLADYQNNSAPT